MNRNTWKLNRPPIFSILCVFVLLQIKKHKLQYFKSFWNVLDVLVILIAVCCVAFNIYRTLAVNKILNSLVQNENEYKDFEFLSYWQVVFNSAVAIMVFFAWVKVFKYISFNKTMTQLSSTLSSCAKDLAGFAVMFFIIFLAFAQLGYLIFGTQVKDFSSFQSAM
jgi:polycystin 2